jgi:hypothetical protein
MNFQRIPEHAARLLAIAAKEYRILGHLQAQGDCEDLSDFLVTNDKAIEVSASYSLTVGSRFQISFRYSLGIGVFSRGGLLPEVTVEGQDLQDDQFGYDYSGGVSGVWLNCDGAEEDCSETDMQLSEALDDLERQVPAERHNAFQWYQDVLSLTTPR